MSTIIEEFGNMSLALPSDTAKTRCQYLPISSDLDLTITVFQNISFRKEIARGDSRTVITRFTGSLQMAQFLAEDGSIIP